MDCHGTRVKADRGFTLPETLIATSIVVSGLVGVAWIFSASITTNMENRNRASAVLLASGKVEELKAAAVRGPGLSNGGGLDPAFPAEGYFDTATMAGATFLRMWEITGGPAKTVRVAVYGAPMGPARARNELIHLTIRFAPGY